MSVQADVLHSTLVRCLDDLDTAEGEIIAAGIVVAFRDKNGKEWYLSYCDRDTFFERIGLFRAALEVSEEFEAEDEEEDEDEG